MRAQLCTCDEAWVWLPYAVRHKMETLEDACIEKLGRDRDVRERVDDEEFMDTIRELPLLSSSG